MSDKGTRAVVRTEHGVTAEITLFEDYSYEVNGILRKDAGPSSLAEVGRLIAELPLDEHGTARVDLV